MPTLDQLAYDQAAVLFFGLVAIIGWKLLVGQISLAGLLDGDRSDGTSYLSPGRVQLLGLTLVSALYYLTQLLEDPTTFPAIPKGLVTVQAGSQAVYLVEKAFALLRHKTTERMEP